MRIVFLETVQNLGGARISTVELASRLAEKHEILILDTYGSCKPFVEFVAKKKLALAVAMPRLTPFMISGSASKFIRLYNLIRFIPHWFQLRLRVHKIIKNFNADLVIVNNSKVLSLLLFFINRQFKIMLFARGWFLPKQVKTKDGFLYKSLVDKFVCVSEATRQVIYASGLAPLENIYVVHNAIEPERLSKEVADIENSDGCVKILHAAGFLPDKGIHISIEIAKILKEKGFKFKLIITGLIYKGHASQTYYNHILKLIKDYELIDLVLIVVNNSNIVPYFRACDILIHPSATEGLPRVIMESMALKKPVIANAVGGVTDYILHNFTGFIANYNNVNDYVNYIELLSEDKILYDTIVDNSYELITSAFNEKMQVKSFDNLFQNSL